MKIRDGQWELFDHNPWTGSTTWTYFDGERTHYRTDHDAEQVVNGNRAAQAEFSRSRRSSEGIGDPVASIPSNLYYEQVLPMVQQHDTKALDRWLRDSDNSAWRMGGKL